MHRLPPLAALRLFEAAGRHGGFTAAATELGVTPSAVSHGVRALEDALGLSLFHRSPRGLALTPAGETLLAEASRAFEGLSRCVEALSGKQPRNRLVGSIAPTFAARWLLPRLPELRRRHPLLDLAISTEREHVQLGDGRIDFAIRMALARTGPAEWHRLAQVRLVPVVAPDCRMSLAQALARLPAIHVTSTEEDWAEWAALRAVAPPDHSRGLRFDTIQMALDAAGRGLGVALARLPPCADDIASGQLRALDDPVEGGSSYWLVTRPGLLRRPEGRMLANWLREELDANAAMNSAQQP
ncbi:LysR family transcriptional regulator [Roseococcus sp. SYP-B2431]|uniref:LysR substrate-binding domain-containing protein n=1 Tax=Roseococcus sp. SYP-B2431 TaxID=2496640 RepID=UPI001038AAD4|nr:LysR substrate-binding domain-containing protein [Roseococcus sp. SYP-B2431]TCH98356.1 LysR family transcriptional regulator [Roseococcus sp. SYP-B2431]